MQGEYIIDLEHLFLWRVFMKQRTILHSDMNNFYASVECHHRPEIRQKAVVVGGDEELRHGIVIAKNYLAKTAGIRTGEALWQAREKCSGLVVLSPNYPLYLRYAKLARAIYTDYTDQIEPFGLDEAWIQIDGENGESVANEIRGRIKCELGVTASVGVSYNKVFAKLGSDLRKPDATTVISQNNYQAMVWPLPVEDMLYVGSATRHKLNKYGIVTIGQLAKTPEGFLHGLLGKVGTILHTFANGMDQSPVMRMDEESQIKSVGNSTTTPRDLENNEDVKIILFVLSESVCARMREHGFLSRTVVISIRDNELFRFERQMKLSKPSCISGEIAAATLQLFQQHYNWNKPVRSIGVRCTDLLPSNIPLQLSMFEDEATRQKMEALDRTIDSLRQRFGHFSVQRASVLADRPLCGIDPKNDHTIHPVGFFRDGMVK